MSYRYGASTLYSSQLARSRDTLRRSLFNLNTLLSENPIMGKSMELRQENNIFEDPIASTYEARSTSPILASARTFSAGVGLSGSRRYPDPSSRGIYDLGYGPQSPQSPIASDDLGYVDRVSERNCCETGSNCDCPVGPTTLQSTERSCADCGVGPTTLQRTERSCADCPVSPTTLEIPESCAYIVDPTTLQRTERSCVNCLVDPTTLQRTERSCANCPVSPTTLQRTERSCANCPVSLTTLQRTERRCANCPVSPTTLQRTERSCANCLVDPTTLQRTKRSCACLVGPTLQRTERFAYIPTSPAGTRTKRDESYGGDIMIPPPKIVGEIAFQLENRMLDFVFSHHARERADVRKRRRYSGHTVQNIAFLIQEEYTNPDGSVNEFVKSQLKDRLTCILVRLAQFGYSLEEHSSFADRMIKEYGLLTNAPDNVTMTLFDIDDADILRGFITLLTNCTEDRRQMLILLECLLYLAKYSGKPVFLN